MKNIRLTLIAFVMLFLSALSTRAYAGEQEVILHREGLFSCYIQYGPHPYDSSMLAEGHLTDKEQGRYMKRANKDIRNMQKYGWLKPGTLDWKEHAYDYHHALKPYDPPPAEWMKPEYDDSDWPRRRDPVFSYRRHQWSNLAPKTHAYLRTWIDVQDPSASITFNLVFRGGARIYLNGQEIASSHLKGNKAEPYPYEAYYRLPEEAKDPKKTRWWALEVKRILKAGSAAGQRILALRNRTMGPLALAQKLLKKGPNLLGIEVHGAGLNLKAAFPLKSKHSWQHMDVVDLEVKADPSKVSSALEPAEGTRIWAEDIHTRVYSLDRKPSAFAKGAIHMVGGRGGTYGGQLVLGTDTQLSAHEVKVSDLESGTSRISKDSIEIYYMVPHAFNGMGYAMGGIRHGNGMNELARTILNRYGRPELRQKQIWEAVKVEAEMAKTSKYYDHLSLEVPESIKAHSLQPIWVSLQVCQLKGTDLLCG